MRKHWNIIFSFCLSSDGSTTYVITDVIGSHQIPCSYKYQVKDQLCLLVKKTLPEGRFIEIEYEPQGKVSALKLPHPVSGKAVETCLFNYGEGYTDVLDSTGLKTSYLFDSRKQLTAIQKFDNQGQLYRTDQKIWGTQKENAGLLLVKLLKMVMVQTKVIAAIDTTLIAMLLKKNCTET